jgi:hypothetical protein
MASHFYGGGGILLLIAKTSCMAMRKSLPAGSVGAASGYVVPSAGGTPKTKKPRKSAGKR